MNHETQRIRLLLSAGALLLCSISSRAEEERWDWVVVNAKIADQPKVTAMAGAGTRIAAFGESQAFSARCKSPCVVMDARGTTVLSGLHDAHAHPTSGGAGFYRVRVSGSNVTQIGESVKAYALKNPALSWIVGRGWNASGFQGRLPTRHDLDRAESKRPVLLLDSDGHQIWTNTAAIRAAGISRDTLDPSGGTIVRDAQGEPTGIFLEAAADLIYARMPDPSAEELRNYILKGEEVGLAAGFTSVHGGPVGLETARAYEELDREKKLTQRVFLWGDLESSDGGFQKLIAWDRALAPDSRVRLGAFKGFVDGVISSYTAAMLAPYSDHSESRGEPAIPQSRLNDLVLRANAAGYPVALHAIGDRAVRMALDAFENSNQVLGHRLINRIEHIESLDPADAPRFGKLGVAASVQPSHMHFGSPGSSYYPERLGPERLRSAFAWKLLQDGGALLLFGTDYPVVPQDPVEGFHCALHRTYGDGTPFQTHQKVDAITAYRAFSLNPARAVGMGRELGRLEVGALADWVAFREDPRTGARTDVAENPPVLLMVGGKRAR